MNNTELWDKVIGRWKKIVNGDMNEYFNKKCAFCEHYGNAFDYPRCFRCPIAIITKADNCNRTKYWRFMEHVHSCMKCNKYEFCNKGVTLIKEFLQELKQIRTKWEDQNE